MTDRTYFDPWKLRELADCFDTPDIALRFLGDYLSMLPNRLTRILIALGERDAPAAMDAVLSLKIASSMNGALMTEACCLALQTSLKNQDFEVARAQAWPLSDSVAVLNDQAPTVLEQARSALGLGCEDTAGADALQLAGVRRILM